MTGAVRATTKGAEKDNQEVATGKSGRPVLRHGPRSLSICASSRVVKPACIMKVTAGIFAPITEQSIETRRRKALAAVLALEAKAREGWSRRCCEKMV